MADNLAADYSDRAIESQFIRPFPLARRAVAVAAAWLVPGGGHLVLGRYWRGLIFLVVIAGSFCLGLALHGKLFWPEVAEAPSTFHYDLITVLWSFAQVGSGLCYVGALLLGIGTTPHPEATTFDYGNTFMFLAGLLNYLVIHDAFDVAQGRKH